MSSLLFDKIPASAKLIDPRNPGCRILNRAILADTVTQRSKKAAAKTTRRIVGIQAENGLETLLTVFTAIEAGDIPAPFAPTTAKDVRDRCLGRLRAAALWTDSDGWSQLGGDRGYPAGFDLVMHSSGSTGLPKPLAIRLDAMHQNSADVAAALRLGPDDIHLGGFSHCYMSGLYNQTLLPLITGATSIIGPILTPSALKTFMDLIHDHRPSVLWLNPLGVRMLGRLRGVLPEVMRGIRFVVSCTAPLAAEDKQQFEQRFGLKVLQSYGLCESLITTVESPDAPALETVGLPIGSGQPVILANDGQVVISNGAMFAGYLDGPIDDEPLAPVQNFATGDLGRFDPQGNLIIEGRRSEVINRGGAKFSPETVEHVLGQLHGVEDCAIVGLPDVRYGTRVVAWVIGQSLSPKTLFSELARRLPRVEQPHDIVVTSSIARTASGKIDRSTMKQRTAEWAESLNT